MSPWSFPRVAEAVAGQGFVVFGWPSSVRVPGVSQAGAVPAPSHRRDCSYSA